MANRTPAGKLFCGSALSSRPAAIRVAVVGEKNDDGADDDCHNDCLHRIHEQEVAAGRLKQLRVVRAPSPACGGKGYEHHHAAEPRGQEREERRDQDQKQFARQVERPKSVWHPQAADEDSSSETHCKARARASDIHEQLLRLKKSSFELMAKHIKFMSNFQVAKPRRWRDKRARFCYAELNL